MEELNRLAVLIDAGTMHGPALRGRLVDRDCQLWRRERQKNLRRLDRSGSEQVEESAARTLHPTYPAIPPYAGGKTATDSAMIIDAMDLLYTG